MVDAGQVLFTLDKREYEAQLMQAQAQLARGEADLRQAQDRSSVATAEANVNVALARLNKADQDVNRLKPLAALRAVPLQDYDDALARQQAGQADVEGGKASLDTAKVNQTAAIGQAQAAIEAANANIRQAKLNVEFCTITSPIRGIAGIRQVAPGNLVGQGEPTLLTTVSNVNPMRVYISISESDYLTYQKTRSEGRGQRAGDLELILADGTTFPQKGRLIIADRAVDLKTGTLSLVAEFPNPTSVLRPGQFGRVRLAATVAQNALLVPQKAVIQMQKQTSFTIVGDANKVALRTVTLGERVGQETTLVTRWREGRRTNHCRGRSESAPRQHSKCLGQTGKLRRHSQKRRIAMAKFFIHHPVFRHCYFPDPCDHGRNQHHRSANRAVSADLAANS